MAVGLFSYALPLMSNGVASSSLNARDNAVFYSSRPCLIAGGRVGAMLRLPPRRKFAAVGPSIVCRGAAADARDTRRATQSRNLFDSRHHAHRGSVLIAGNRAADIAPSRLFGMMLDFACLKP